MSDTESGVDHVPAEYRLQPVKCFQCGCLMVNRLAPHSICSWTRWVDGVPDTRKYDRAGCPEWHCPDCDVSVTDASADDWVSSKWRQVFNHLATS